MITLSTFDKTGQEGSTIPVVRQRSFIGRVLPSAVADIPCAELGVQGVLEKLNVLDCTPGSPRYNAWEYFVAEDCDLGTAYAHLRYKQHVIDIGKHVTEAREYDEKMRRDLLEKREIGNYAPPRRLWDLRANRVVPWWATSIGAWAISHAWVANENLKYEMTPINGYEWPVPMPKDADLDCIRIEMLNLGAEYVWLDVLCLRQAGRGEDPRGHIGKRKWRRREAVRKEEWKVDLPMIGWVYQNVHQVACYLSGLGLPLSFKTDRDFENERCWFNRAWTLQETPRDVIIAGRTHNNDRIDKRFMTMQTYRMLEHRLKILHRIQQWAEGAERIFCFLEEMKKRKSSNPVDKVTGLVYLFQLKHIPIYDADQCEEDAWTELLNAADGQLRASFLFFYPKPNGDGSWRPSWQQLMTETFLTWSYISRSIDLNVHWTEKDGDWCGGPRMDACHVRGLADESQKSPRLADESLLWPYRQYGKLNVKDSSGGEHTIDIYAEHEYPIPDGLYTLLGVIGDSLQVKRSFWVVGKVDGPEGRFRKVSVVTMEESCTGRLKNLNVYRYTKTPLL